MLTSSVYHVLRGGPTIGLAIFIHVRGFVRTVHDGSNYENNGTCQRTGGRAVLIPLFPGHHVWQNGHLIPVAAITLISAYIIEQCLPVRCTMF